MNQKDFQDPEAGQVIQTKNRILGLFARASASQNRLTKLEGLRTKYQAIADEERNPRRMEHALDFLFTRPVLTVRQLESGLGITYTGAKRYIEKLVEAGILKEVTGYARNRIFRADEIYEALEEIGDQAY